MALLAYPEVLEVYFCVLGLPSTSIYYGTRTQEAEGYYQNSNQEVLGINSQHHTGKCKSTGGCYNELVVAYFGTGGGVKWRKR